MTPVRQRGTLLVRRAAGLGLAGLSVLLAGCAVGPLDQPGTAPPAPLPADQLVFIIETTGGMVPTLDQVLGTASLAVYGDGRVMEADHDRYVEGAPWAYVVSRVDPVAVAEFAADAEARDVVDPATDFGDPPVTDMPVSTVHLHGAGAGAPQLVHVYAFADDFEDDVSGHQRRARRELAEIVERAYSLPDQGERAAYTPEQVKVTELSRQDAVTDHPVWPGPDPGTFLKPAATSSGRTACGTLSGPTATAAYAAARANPGAGWMVGTQIRTLAVVPLLPGTEGCG